MRAARLFCFGVGDEGTLDFAFGDEGVDLELGEVGDEVPDFIPSSFLFFAFCAAFSRSRCAYK